MVDYLSGKRSKYSGYITMLYLKMADKLYFCIYIINKAHFFLRFVEKSKHYKVYYTLKER